MSGLCVCVYVYGVSVLCTIESSFRITYASSYSDSLCEHDFKSSDDNVLVMNLFLSFQTLCGKHWALNIQHSTSMVSIFLFSLAFDCCKGDDNHRM